MHGIVRPASADVVVERDWRDVAKAKLHEYRFFLLLVILPTLLVAGYYYLIASDQYESEADFIVRSSQSSVKPASGIGAFFSMGVSSKMDEAMSVIDYLKSTEATLEIDKSTGLAKRFHRPEVDPISRLRSANPSPEKLRKYYNKQVKLKYDKDSGIAKLTVHAFTPEDAYAIANRLLALGERRVNELNVRSNRDALESANRLLAEAENDLQANQVSMTAFRKVQADIDPEATGKAQMTTVTGVNSQLAAANAQLQAMRGIIAPSSPQYIAAQARVRALTAEAGRQNSRLAGQGSGTIANRIGNYESLRIKQDFLAKRYALAAGAVESAREEARKQELYLVRVVNPNMPVSSLFPERGWIVLTVFASLIIAYGIGWLLVAGIREHANG